VAIAAAVSATAGCGQATESPTATPAPPPAPLIVQVENSDAARPQTGLGGAAIVYEYVAEGGVSRFSAIYPHPPATQVGPIRSARLATLSLLRLYQGVLIYSGADQYIQGLLDASGLPHYDETTAAGDLFRVDSRAPPHNLYSDGPHLADALKHAAAPSIAYSFFNPTSVAVQGKNVASFTVPLSKSEAPTWTWDPSHKSWTRSEPDTGQLVDAANQQPLRATTVIVQQVAITVAPQVVDVNGVLGVSHELTGSGNAQVFDAGQQFDATWTQVASGPPMLTLAGGTSAPVTTGSVWIELVADGSPVKL